MVIHPVIHYKMTKLNKKPAWNAIPMIGKRFGNLIVLYADDSKLYNSKWICECDCGNIISTYGYRLRKGTKSNCGCLKPKKWDDMDPRGPSTREVAEYEACLERQRQRQRDESK